MSPMKFVAGTSGDLNYLVLALRSRCVAAIKPELQVRDRVLMMGVRVRICPNPELDGLDMDNLFTATEIGQAFPNFLLSEVNAKRGSNAVTATVMLQGKNVTHEVEQIINHKDQVGSFVEVLHKRLGVPEFLVPDAIVASFINEGWSDIVVQASLKHRHLDEEQLKVVATNWLNEALKQGGQSPA